MDAISRTCRHCGTENLVAECSQDARTFVLTTAHVEGRRRDFDDGPIQQLPQGFEALLCDYCTARAAGLGPLETLDAACVRGPAPRATPSSSLAN